MPSDRASALRDIKRHIDLAIQFVKCFDYGTFREDTPFDCLERNGGRGQHLRHEYEDVVEKLVWDTVQLVLPP